MAKRTIISASPRAMGKCNRVAKELASMLSAAHPHDEVEVIRLADLDIHYCNGCNVCEADGECFMEDDMTTVIDTLNNTDALFVVSPIYYAGPPGNYKAMLDRLQPFYWSWEKGLPKRPLVLVALGDGGDPNGYEPLVTCTRSAMAVAGFRLMQTHAFIDASSTDIASALTKVTFPDEA